MAEIKVEDLMRSIRERARESAAQQTDPSSADSDNFARSMAKVETSLTITRRTQDQLPPVTTYRIGLVARVELGIKRLLKRATHWYTWEQVNFNKAVDSALNNILAVLQKNEQRLAHLQTEVSQGLVWQSNFESHLTEVEQRVSLVESRFDAQLKQKLAEVTVDHQRSLGLLVDEQRVCFKQLALEISEAGVIADRAKRSIQLRLDELAARVDAIGAEQSEVKDPVQEIVNNRDAL